jgi:hypothetical protein
MGSRSRIRWRKVAKLALGMIGCLSLFLGLPGLLRRPDPPPLEPDIGLASLAHRETAPSDRRRLRDGRRDARSEGPRVVPSARPRRRAGRPTSTGSPIVAVAPPAPVPDAVPVADPPPPAPPAAPPTGPPPPPPKPAAPSEFGFER